MSSIQISSVFKTCKYMYLPLIKQDINLAVYSASLIAGHLQLTTAAIFHVQSIKMTVAGPLCDHLS